MTERPKLIVMLTYNDLTVPNAFDIFDRCRNTRAAYWGFKEENLPLPEMRSLFAYMKAQQKHTALEVVAYTEDECLAGAEIAVECGCEILMGTTYSDAINRLCQNYGLRYMPFVGQVSERPSVLNGSLDNMLSEAEDYLRKGVFGIDLLGYRFVGDKAMLNREFVRRIGAPVCIAGSIDSFQRLDDVIAASPWAFTIGSAFFDSRFGNEFASQINTVCDYIEARELSYS